MTPLQTALWIVLSVALVISVVTDLATHKILDLVTWPTLFLALLLRLIHAGPLDLEEGPLMGALCAAGAALPFAIGAFRGKMGWGDVKLMAAVGAVSGWPLVMYAVTCVSLAGALQAVVTVIWKGEVWDTTSNVLRRWGKRARLVAKDAQIPESKHIPYGVAIAAGTFWAMWWQYPVTNSVR
ncbi:MAG: prepilin peptidase [Myxococcaceae bacterium]